MADVVPGSTATATGTHRLLLFVSGNSQYADNANRAVRALCRHPSVGQCELQVIDVARDPEAAKAYGVIVTPC